MVHKCSGKLAIVLYDSRVSGLYQNTQILPEWDLVPWSAQEPNWLLGNVVECAFHICQTVFHIILLRASKCILQGVSTTKVRSPSW